VELSIPAAMLTRQLMAAGGRALAEKFAGKLVEKARRGSHERGGRAESDFWRLTIIRSFAKGCGVVAVPSDMSLVEGSVEWPGSEQEVPCTPSGRHADGSCKMPEINGPPMQ